MTTKKMNRTQTSDQAQTKQKLREAKNEIKELKNQNKKLNNQKKEMQKVIDDMQKFINEYTEHMSVEEAIAMTKNKKKKKYDSGKRKLMDSLKKEFGGGK